MAKRPKKKQYTLAEFRAWLSGIEEIQPNNWTPDTAQWKMIRDKIENIIEEVVEVEVPVQHTPQPGPGSVPPMQMPTHPPAQPMAPPSGGGWAAPAAPALPAEPTLTPAAQAALNGKLPTEFGTTGKSKTGDVDTSDGNYDSNFG